MKRNGLLCCLLVLGLAMAPGCDPDPATLEADLNADLIESISTEPVDQAILSQHTLFPYHFVTNSPDLNELGQRDLCVLTKHLKDHPGPLNVRRGDAPLDLYQARLVAVMNALVAGGVDRGRIRIDSAPAGGEGMDSRRVLHILDLTPPSEVPERSPASSTTSIMGS